MERQYFPCKSPNFNQKLENCGKLQKKKKLKKRSIAINFLILQIIYDEPKYASKTGKGRPKRKKPQKNRN